MEVLLYTDGSCVPNDGTGYSGYGIHMAIIDYEKKTKAIMTKYGLTPKGYFLRKEIKADKGLKEVGLHKVYEIYGYNPNSITNQQAELDAIIQAFKAIDVFNEKDSLGLAKITILSDSIYCLRHLKKMLDDEMDIETVNANRDKVEELFNLYKKIKDKFQIEIDKVPAHSGNLGNDRADLLSNMGRLRNMDNDKQTEYIYEGKEDFWKLPNIDIDLFHFKQLFRFYPDDLEKPIYYGINYKNESDIGKKISYVTYTILKLSKPEPLVTKILTKIRESLKDLYVPYIVNMSNLTNKKILFDYLKYGDHITVIDKKPYLTISTLDGKELARVLEPTGLSNVVMENMEYAKNTILTFLDKSNTLDKYIDITDTIYEINAKKKITIKKEIKDDKYIITYKLDDATIKLKMKYDLPPRNLLKKLATKNPKVILLLRDRGPLYEYKTITTTGNGDLIYTDNIYSNKAIKKQKKGAK